MLIILSIIAVIFTICLKVMYNNELESTVDLNEKDKYVSHDFEVIISELNYYIEKNKLNLKNDMETGITEHIDMDRGSIHFNKGNNKFEVIFYDDDNHRNVFNAAYAVEGDNVYLIPEKKYSIERESDNGL